MAKDKLKTTPTGKPCPYVTSPDDVDMDVLEELVRVSVEHVRTTSA